jgi:hypothetical protein
LVPNLPIRRIVEQLLLTNLVSLHEPSSSKHRCGDFRLHATGNVPFATKMLHGELEEQQMSTYEVWKFSKQNMFYQSFLVDVDANMREILMSLLRGW